MTVEGNDQRSQNRTALYCNVHQPQDTAHEIPVSKAVLDSKLFTRVANITGVVTKVLGFYWDDGECCGVSSAHSTALWEDSPILQPLVSDGVTARGFTGEVDHITTVD